MTRLELGAALLTVYALALAREERGRYAAAVYLHAARVETFPTRCGDWKALRAAGYVQADGTLTPRGRDVLAQVLDGGTA